MSNSEDEDIPFYNSSSNISLHMGLADYFHRNGYQNNIYNLVIVLQRLYVLHTIFKAKKLLKSHRRVGDGWFYQTR